MIVQMILSQQGQYLLCRFRLRKRHAIVQSCFPMNIWNHLKWYLFLVGIQLGLVY